LNFIYALSSSTTGTFPVRHRDVSPLCRLGGVFFAGEPQRLFPAGVDVRLLKRQRELDDLVDLGVVRGFVEFGEDFQCANSPASAMLRKFRLWSRALFSRSRF
jgi:hypothetical protein